MRPSISTLLSILLSETKQIKQNEWMNEYKIPVSFCIDIKSIIFNWIKFLSLHRRKNQVINKKKKHNNHSNQSYPEIFFIHEIFYVK